MSEVTWLTSYPKSGNTWMRIMLRSYLLAKQLDSIDHLGDFIPDIHDLLNRGRMLPLDGPEPLIVKTHFLPCVEVQAPYKFKTAKVLYLVRNPRDVILSTVRHFDIDDARSGAFARDFITNRGASIWRRLGYGAWHQHVQEWLSPMSVHQYFPNAAVLVVRYEDLRSDPVGKLQEIVEFLRPGDTVDQARLRSAVADSSLDRLRAIEEADLSRGMSAYRPPRERFFGQGLCGQSLACLGQDVEDSYQQLMAEDEEFSRCANKFGYER